MLPRIYPQIRLPIYAVLAYAVSVVDMAIILAPGTPPPLAPLLLRWFNDADLAMRFPAAAGAVLQLVLVCLALLAWFAAERLIARAGRAWLSGGGRGARRRLAPILAGTAMGLMVGLAALALLSLLLWSFAERWRFPDSLPAVWTVDTWASTAGALTWPLGTTAVVGAIAAVAALALALACLENEQREGLHLSNRGLWLLYLPLIAPQISFLFGLQVLLARVGIDGGWLALVWSHLLFVLPYVFLALAEPFRALDPRYARAALCLGASPARVLWRVKLPILAGPVLAALAVGFAVSVALYLPTVFAGAGRFVTLTTEAVTLAAGADRRVAAVYAVLQAALPLIAFGFALAAMSQRRARTR